MQMDNGLYFIHEHPAGARSWDNEMINRLTKESGVYTVVGDMCRLSMQQEDELGKGLIKKRTMFMTNAEMIAGKLAKRCVGGHRHIELINGRAKRAEVYPEDLCKDMVRAVSYTHLTLPTSVPV